jgi:hypothetical protein
MKKLNYIILFLFILVGNLVFAQEQTPDSTLRVITKFDGTEYIGKIISDDGREVLIDTDLLGKIYIPKSDIKSILRVDDTRRIVHGQYRETGPFTTRYSFTNNAHPVTKGENYALLNLYGPEVHFALTDNFSLGIMSTWIASPMVLALKYSFPTNNEDINFSIGTLFGTSGYLNTFKGYGGLHWANVTFGNRMNNITISGGYGYLDAGFDSYMSTPGVYHNTYPTEDIKKPIFNGPMASIAGVVKVGSKVSFVFDSMFMYLTDETTVTDYVNDSYYDDVNGIYVEDFTYTVTAVNNRGVAMMFMPGLRFQKTEKNAFQFNLAGVAIVGDDNESFPFPMCTWFVRF